jgi:hypothetical protein
VFRDQYLPKHAHLIPTLRHLFSTSIASCFSKIKLTHLQKWLDLPQNEVGKWCETVGWTVEGEVAVVPKNGDNDVKAGVVKENVELSREFLPTSTQDVEHTADSLQSSQNWSLLLLTSCTDMHRIHMIVRDPSRL